MNNNIADSAIVSNGTFTHYCHKIKSLMVLRIYHAHCPLCMQKNPDYISNRPVFTVCNLLTGSTVLIFAEQSRAIQYIQDHPLDSLALGDTGYVDEK